MPTALIYAFHGAEGKYPKFILMISAVILIGGTVESNSSVDWLLFIVPA
jgi:hypothetical protein